MLVIVVAIFGICWLPLHLFTLLLDFSSIVERVDMELLTSIFISCHWLAMSNSFANPIIYSFTNESFRADLVTLLYMWFPCCVCLTKILPRHSSGSTYETVVFRRQSLYKQEAKISGAYHTRTVHGTRANKPYLNGDTVHTKLNRLDYETMRGNDRSRCDRSTNGLAAAGHVPAEGGLEYVRLAPVYGRETSVSGDSSAGVELSEATASNNSAS